MFAFNRIVTINDFADKELRRLHGENEALYAEATQLATDNQSLRDQLALAECFGRGDDELYASFVDHLKQIPPISISEEAKAIWQPVFVQAIRRLRGTDKLQQQRIMAEARKSFVRQGIDPMALPVGTEVKIFLGPVDEAGYLDALDEDLDGRMTTGRMPRHHRDVTAYVTDDKHGAMSILRNNVIVQPEEVWAGYTDGEYRAEVERIAG